MTISARRQASRQADGCPGASSTRAARRAIRPVRRPTVPRAGRRRGSPVLSPTRRHLRRLYYRAAGLAAAKQANAPPRTSWPNSSRSRQESFAVGAVAAQVAPSIRTVLTDRTCAADASRSERQAKAVSSRAWSDSARRISVRQGRQQRRQPRGGHVQRQVGGIEPQGVESALCIGGESECPTGCPSTA